MQVHLLVTTAQDGAQLVLQAFECHKDAVGEMRRLTSGRYIDADRSEPSVSDILKCGFHIRSILVKPTPSYLQEKPNDTQT